MPVEEGEPPVVIARVPGKESDGREDVVASRYRVPRARRPAKAERGGPRRTLEIELVETVDAQKEDVLGLSVRSMAPIRPRHRRARDNGGQEATTGQDECLTAAHAFFSLLELRREGRGLFMGRRPAQ